MDDKRRCQVVSLPGRVSYYLIVCQVKESRRNSTWKCVSLLIVLYGFTHVTQRNATLSSGKSYFSNVSHV